MEGTFPIKISWGKQKFEITVSTADTLEDFKAKIYSESNVLPGDQKILYKGKQLKDDAEFKLVAPNSLVMLMGQATAQKMNIESKPATKFIEDLTPEERNRISKDKTGEILPSGLHNLGNTCYMNSTIQLLNKIPELAKEIEKAHASAQSEWESEILVNAFKKLFFQLKSKGESFAPKEFVVRFMSIFPMFAERTEGDRAFKQQDANECLIQILNHFTLFLSKPKPQGGPAISIVDELFNINMITTLKNTESEAEEPSIMNDVSKSLSCIIDNQGNPINNILDGLRAGLTEKIEKNSELLGRQAIYEKSYKIDMLPPYLFIQMIRFVWKQADSGAGTKANKAKINRQVNFTHKIDMYEFCTEGCKSVLDIGRAIEKKRAEEKKKFDEIAFDEFCKKAQSDPKLKDLNHSVLASKYKETKAEEELKNHDENLWRQHGEPNIPTGNYELIGFVAHLGRNADSGHYIALIHKSGEEWYQYDDAKVSVIPLQKALDMNGGPDCFSAYICLYRRIDIMPDAN